MPGPSSAAERRPHSTTCPRAVRGTPTPAERSEEWPLQLVRGSGGPDECPRTPSTVQVILVTEGGLELPLVASPVQVARLLDSAREGGSGGDRDGPLPSSPDGRRGGAPRRVRADQLLRRVRLVVRLGTSIGGDAS